MKITKGNSLDKIRLVFFSTAETEFRQFEFNLQRVLTVIFASVLILGGVFLVSVAICNKLYQDNTNTSLVKTNLFLKSKLKKLHSNMENLNEKLQMIEENTEDLEVFVGLTSTASDSDTNRKNLLKNKSLVMASIPIDNEYDTDKMTRYLNNLEQRMQQALDVQHQIEDQFIETRQEIKHIPSIRPILGARITDKFGNRRDPFIERFKHHNGVDLSARYGTKVYAAAAGVVEFTRVRYRLNKGYGKVVILNHDYGYKTLYGHLSKIFVKPGQKVQRWQLIGLSGDTGRATGPHLHYEVWQNGKPQNPEDYILN